MITRRGVILPVVLFILLLVGLLAAMYSFRVHADASALYSVSARMQTRLAAEAGIDRVKLLLRTARYDMGQWYHNPDELHRIIVWAHDRDANTWGTNEELGEGAMVYRFSIVADDPTDDERYVRFGITDESARLNLNQATGEQLVALIQAVFPEDQGINAREIVAAILDWRDKDSAPSGETGDTEGDFYRDLEKPYRVKNGPFDTVEELLLVKGVTGYLLYGEDYDRNGLLTPNEDDGDLSFPPDNQDGILNRGLYPYLTVHSREDDVSNANRRRVYLFGDAATLTAELAEIFPDEPAVVDFIVSATRNQSGQGGAGGGGGKSGGSGGGGSKSGGRGADATVRDGVSPAGARAALATVLAPGEDKAAARLQRRDGAPPPKGGDQPSGGDGTSPPPNDGAAPPPSESEGDVLHGGDEEDDEADPQEDGQEPPAEGEAGGGAGQRMKTPASLLKPQMIGDEERPSPLGLEHLPILLDRTTVVSPSERGISGLINVNTAPAVVLRMLPGLSEDQIRMIMDMRAALDATEKATTAWLLQHEVMDLTAFERIAPLITARGQQFTIEALGYGDHIGMISRLQVVVDMVGPIAHTIYYRDLTQLGGRYPIREKDREVVRGN